MALDNLIEFGGAYSQAPQPVLPPLALTDHDFGNLLGAVFILLVGSTIAAVERGREVRRKSSRTWQVAVRSAVVMLAATAFVMLALLAVTGTVVPNRFNFVALSVVSILELFKIGAVLIRPLVVRLGHGNSIIRFLLGTEPPSPPGRRKSTERGKDADRAPHPPRRRRGRKPAGEGV
jgi:hypothetical protein